MEEYNHRCVIFEKKNRGLDCYLNGSWMNQLFARCFVPRCVSTVIVVQVHTGTKMKKRPNLQNLGAKKMIYLKFDNFLGDFFLILASIFSHIFKFSCLNVVIWPTVQGTPF